MLIAWLFVYNCYILYIFPIVHLIMLPEELICDVASVAVRMCTSTVPRAHSRSRFSRRSHKLLIVDIV